MKTTRDQINKFLSRLKKGDDCLNEFIRYSRGYIQYIAYKYLIDKSLVEDAVFLAYYKIVHAVTAFDESKNGMAWIVKIAQNEAYKLNRNEVDKCDALDEYKNALSCCRFGEDERLDKYNVEKAMENLDEQERAIVEHKVFGGYTVREISEITGMSKSTVAFVFKKALKKLEKFLL